MAQALADRLEIRVAADRLGIAEAQRKATAAEYLPSVSFFGNYGSSGLKPNADQPSHARSRAADGRAAV